MIRGLSASLTLRLGLWFLAVAALAIAGVGSYLYRSLAEEMRAREDRDLLEKVAYIRHLLEETPSVAAIRADPHRFVDAAAGHDGMMLVLKTVDGEVLMQSADMPDRSLVLPVTPPDQLPDPGAVQHWVLQSGAQARVVAAWGAVGHSAAARIHIVIARSTAATASLLASYRANVYAAVLVGALLAGALGYLIARRGLQPIRLIACQAHTITAQRLDNRLDVSAAPAELQALVQSFNAMLDRLHESFQRLTQFSADLAHDLRTPINNLMVQAQVVLGQPRSPEEYQSLLESNIEEYERVARMIESMLFLARADHARVALRFEVLDVRAQLQRVADYFEGIADERGVTLEVIGNVSVYADPALLRRAVNNLVANAVRYAARGSVVRLTTESDGQTTAVSVTNCGMPIDPAHLPRIFDRFYRVEPSRSEPTASAGLGLAIVQSIMQLHGGRAEVDSGGGYTTFRLLFPLAPQTGRAQVARADPS